MSRSDQRDRGYDQRVQEYPLMGWYDGDSWSNHISNFIECAECESEFDQQDQEGGNICPTCIDKEEGESE